MALWLARQQRQAKRLALEDREVKAHISALRVKDARRNKDGDVDLRNFVTLFNAERSIEQRVRDYENKRISRWWILILFFFWFPTVPLVFVVLFFVKRVMSSFLYQIYGYIVSAFMWMNADEITAAYLPEARRVVFQPSTTTLESTQAFMDSLARGAADRGKVQVDAYLKDDFLSLDAEARFEQFKKDFSTEESAIEFAAMFNSSYPAPEGRRRKNFRYDLDPDRRREREDMELLAERELDRRFNDQEEDALKWIKKSAAQRRMSLSEYLRYVEENTSSSAPKFVAQKQKTFDDLLEEEPTGAWDDEYEHGHWEYEALSGGVQIHKGKAKHVEQKSTARPPPAEMLPEKEVVVEGVKPDNLPFTTETDKYVFELLNTANSKVSHAVLVGQSLVCNEHAIKDCGAVAVRVNNMVYQLPADFAILAPDLIAMKVPKINAKQLPVAKLKVPTEPVRVRIHDTVNDSDSVGFLRPDGSHDLSTKPGACGAPLTDARGFVFGFHARDGGAIVISDRILEFFRRSNIAVTRTTKPTTNTGGGSVTPTTASGGIGDRTSSSTGSAVAATTTV